MKADSSPGNPSEKRAILPGCAALIFHLLRMFWVTGLALLLVVVYGLYAGWSEPKQWSNAFFYAAIAQIFIAAIAMSGLSEEMSAASEVRYIAKGNVSDTRNQLFQMDMGKMTFSLRVFIGGLLTILIAAVCLWV